MPKRRRIFPQERRRLQKHAIERASADVKGPVCFYEQWLGEEHSFIFIDGSPKELRTFCSLVWQDAERKKQCYEDHLHRVIVCENSGISTCWLGVDSVCCPIQDEYSGATLLGGYFRVKEQKELGEAKLQNFLVNISSEEAKKLQEAWQQIPEISKEEALTQRVGSLEKAGQLYLQDLKERDEFRSVTDLTTHDIATMLQIIIAEIETLQIELKETFNIGKRWQQRFESLIEICEQHAEYLDKSLETRFKNQYNHYRRDSISKLIYECADIYTSVSQERGIEIRVDLEQQVNALGEHQVLYVCMDRVMLRQALRNVIDNAVKYSFSGTAKHARWIDIVGRLHTVSDQKGYQISVQNLGIGLELDELEHVFEPGYQGRRRLEEGRRGHGMGLAFVKECVEKHEGTVSIRSQPQQRTGWLTTVTIWLPLDSAKCAEGA